VSMDLRPEVVALMRNAQTALDSIRGERNDYNDLLGEAFRCLLAMHAGGDANQTAREGGEHAGESAAEYDVIDPADALDDVKARPVTRTLRAQIATITTCESCAQAWQLAAGRKIALTAAELEAAECDAVHIGSLDGGPQRATSAIPPATERFVKHRDGERCTVPGCRSSQNLEVHHIMHRAHGGTNNPSNLTTLCWGHHAAHHRGELHIAGKAPRITVSRTLPVPHVGDRPHAEVPDHGLNARAVDVLGVPPQAEAEARLALTTLGFTKPVAAAAVAKAQAGLRSDASLEELVRAALRECPR